MHHEHAGKGGSFLCSRGVTNITTIINKLNQEVGSSWAYSPYSPCTGQGVGQDKGGGGVMIQNITKKMDTTKRGTMGYHRHMGNQDGGELSRLQNGGQTGRTDPVPAEKTDAIQASIMEQLSDSTLSQFH